jgi:hypothetical protein
MPKAEWTDAQRTLYKRACHFELKGMLTRESDRMARPGLELVEVSLEVGFPDTRIRLVLMDRRIGGRRQEEFEIWKNDLFDAGEVSETNR